MAQLACVLVLAWCCLAGALPTQSDKTLVVTRVDTTDPSVTGAPVSEPASHVVLDKTPISSVDTADPSVTGAAISESVSDVAASDVVASSSTEGPLVPIKISEMDVKSEVSLRYSHTTVVTRVRNSAVKAQETTFHVLLPDTAFISGFIMTLNGKPYKAYVKEKEEAKQIYNQAVSQGLGAAHIATKARDSNQFTVSINVEPKTEALFNLTYEELLQRRNGIYNHAINLHPRTLVPKLTVTVHIKEGTKITTLRVPELRTGNEIDANENDKQNSKVKIDKTDDGKEATITFTPDLDEQKKLMESYAKKSIQSKTDSLRSYYGDISTPTESTVNEGNLGQFVVQYDVDRPNDGEILVNNGYFVHFFAPTKLPPLNKHVIFVLDTSGSMSGRKIDQLHEAMVSILDELNHGDYFNLVEFSFGVDVHDLKEADSLETKKSRYSWYNKNFDKPTNLIPPSQATPENIEKAKVIVKRMIADGGTNINDALKVAIDLVTKGIGGNSPVEQKDVKDVTAASTTTENMENQTQVENPESSRLEPIIIFLTDGEPTVGDTNVNHILNQVSEKNYGYHKAAIFSLAFGEDADRTFLRKLSLRNDAFMRHIYEAADAALQLRHFYKQVSSPLLSDVRFVYPQDQVKDETVTKHRFHSYYDGSEVVVAGKIEDDKQLTPEVLAFCGVDDSYTRKKYKVTPKITSRKADDYLPLERLWAYLTIKQLLDKADLTDKQLTNNNDDKQEETPEKKALNIALKYEFVTPLTSLVVVKPNATSAVDAESVDKPDTPSYASSGGIMAFKSANMFAALPLSGIPGPPSAGSLSNAPLPLFSSSMALASLPFNDPIPPGVYADPIQVDEEYDVADIRVESHHQFGFSAAGAVPYYRFSADGSLPSYQNSYRTPISYSGLPRITTSRRRAQPAKTDHETMQSMSFPAPIVQYDLANRGYIASTTPPTYIQATEKNLLDKYRLNEFSWTKDLLKSDADAIEVSVNGTVTSLKLSTDEANDPASDGGECPDDVSGGGPGVCTYLVRCDAAKTITAQDYNTKYCDLNGFAGVCCPKKEEK